MRAYCRADAAAVSQQNVASQHAPAVCQNLALGLQGDLAVFNNKTTPHLVITHVSKELILYFFLLFSKNNLPDHGGKGMGETLREVCKKEIKSAKKEEKMVDKLISVITEFGPVDLCL